MKRLLPFLVLIALIPSCKSLDLKKKPKAKLEDYRISAITLRDLTLEYDISINNPYPIGLRLDGIEVTLYIENKRLVKNRTARGFRIKANGKETTVYRATFKYRDLAGIVKDYSKKEYLNCRADIKVMIPLPNIPGLAKYITIPFTVNKRIPTLKPSIKVASFRVKSPKVDFRTGDIKLKAVYDIELENKTKAKVDFTSVDYNVKMNNRTIGKGATTSLKKRGNKSILRVENTLSSKKLGKSLLKMIQRKKGNYILTGSTKIKLPREMSKKSLPLNFSTKGGI